MVLNVLKHWLDRVGASTVAEPRDLWSVDERRPDILVVLGADTYMIDVAVVHPTCPTNVHRAHKPLGAAAYMEHTKHARYDRHAITIGAICCRNSWRVRRGSESLHRHRSICASPSAWEPHEISRGIRVACTNAILLLQL
jgi:hypothetical protein